MKAYKLVRLRKDGTMGPLFINPRQRLRIGEWLPAENHPTPGFKVRPGWHCVSKPLAPHLSERGRVWVEISIKEWERHVRSKHQGGVWYTAKQMRVNRILTDEQVNYVRERRAA